jgi:uncharacterized protein YndB with AHSA1/START domain
MLANGNPEVVVTLPSDTEIRFTCLFRHSAQILFEAWTRPEHIRHWWGCHGATISTCEVDLRIGGSWKIMLRMSDGSGHSFHGVYREIIPGKRLVYSECYDMPQLGNPEWLTTVTFEETGGGTQLTHTIRHSSRQVRDGHLKAGMETGAVHQLRNLDAYTQQMLKDKEQN